MLSPSTLLGTGFAKHPAISTGLRSLASLRNATEELHATWLNWIEVAGFLDFARNDVKRWPWS